MANLRLGILNLEIILGRYYDGIPLFEYFCKLCCSGLVQDKYAFCLSAQLLYKSSGVSHCDV